MLHSNARIYSVQYMLMLKKQANNAEYGDRFRILRLPEDVKTITHKVNKRLLRAVRVLSP